MGNEMKEVSTSTTLLNALHKAAGQKVSSEEVLEQRVSFVMGSLRSQNAATRERVRQVIIGDEGDD